MTGKIFERSSNIYQDQAKILFDYYKSAAETIVSAEMAEEQNRADLVKQKNEMLAQANKAKIIAIVMFAVAAVFLICIFAVNAILFALTFVAAAVVGVVFLVKFSKSKNEAGNFEQMIAECDARFRNIRREYKVDKIGVVYVPVATKVPFEDKSIVLDHTGVVGETDFNLTVLNQPDDFQDSVQELSDSLNSLPVVETSEMTENVNTSDYSTSIQNVTLYDYTGSIDRQVRNISYLLSDSNNASVRIPVVNPQSKTADNLRNYATTDIGSHNVVKVFDVSFDDRLEKFASLNALKDQIKATGDSDSSEYIKRLMRRLAESVQLLTKTKISSQNKLTAYTSSIFNLVLKAGYTQYSPALEAEEIERASSESFFEYHTAVNDYAPFSLKKSSIVKYELFSDSWIAEDGSRTSMPFGMHQIDEEIFAPIISSLMEENKIERLKIYNSIDDQKRMYVDRWKAEIGNYFRDNRKSADDIINHMREAYADFMNAHSLYQSLYDTNNTMKKSGSISDGEVKEVDEQAEMIAGFDVQAAECNRQQEEFSEYMDRINESIDDTTRRFEFIEYYEGSLRDSVAHETAMAFSNLQSLDARHRGLVGVSPYVARKAVLPPEPTVSSEVFDSIQTDLVQVANGAISESSEITAPLAAE